MQNFQLHSASILPDFSHSRWRHFPGQGHLHIANSAEDGESLAFLSISRSGTAMDIPAAYHSWIDWIGDGTGLPDSILHIHAGMTVLLAARVITRRSLGTLFPFAFVVMAEVGNEVMDYLLYGWRTADTLLDLANTFFWPFVLSLGIRLRPMRAHATR